MAGSLYFNNWPPLEEMVVGDGEGRDGWMLDIPLVTPDGIDILSHNNQVFFDNILASVNAKAQTGM